MIEEVSTVGKTESHVIVYRDKGEKVIEGVEKAPNHADLIDSLEDEIREAIESGARIDFREVASRLVNQSERAVMRQLLVRLLIVLGDSKNVRADIELLISCAGLSLRDIPDLEIAAKLGLTRQAFSARKKALMKKLDLAPPAHSKSLSACREYQLSNRKNGSI